jgi:hypothetical protein
VPEHSNRPELRGLRIADPPARWQTLGFAVTEARVELGGVRLHLGARGAGITGWVLSGVEPVASIDGLPTETVGGPPSPATATHPNGAIGIDHAVVVAPEFDRTSRALATAGMPLRHVTEMRGVRQGFRRLGPVILELVEAPGEPTAGFWGLVVVVEDLDALAGRLGEHLGAIKPAVQPGRKIATLRDSAGLSTKVAFMDRELR